MMHEYEAYHVHSYYSNCLTWLDSTMRIEDYAKVMHERGQKVLCISEHGNRSNVWKQFEVANSFEENKMVPLAAAEIYFVPDRNPELKDGRNFHMILIAKDMEGFYQLNFALSQANETGFYRRARVDFELLRQLDYRHFICTTACVAGVVKDLEGEKLVRQLRDIFHENLYLEVQHHPQEIQLQHNKKCLELSQQLHIPLIYATDSHYIRHEDAILRKELMKSGGITYEYEDEFDLFLPDQEEAFLLMKQQGILPVARIEEAMENTLQLREFAGVSFDTERKFPISRPNLKPEERERLYKHMVCDGYIAHAGMPTKEEVEEIHKEMDIVTRTKSYDYFIGLYDMLELGVKKGGVLTTTGRGSACSFVSNFALNFSTINRLHAPIKMYAARFLSEAKAKVSMPD